MTEVLQTILKRFDLEHAGPLTVPEARRLGLDAIERMANIGVLRKTTPATSVRNDWCDHGCDMQPDIVTHAVTGERFGVYGCTRGDCGLVRIPLDDLRRWELDLAGTARAVARAIDAGGAVAIDVPERLVEIGRVVAGELWRDVFLARGLAWSDASSTLADARRLKASSAPLVLALGTLPSADVWADCRPALGLLADIASLADHGLDIDLSGLVNREPRPHPGAIQKRWLTVTEAAQQLLEDVSGIDLDKAKARVSKAAKQGRFITNDKKGPTRRIDQHSFSTWRLEQRAKDLAAYDSNL